MRDLFKTESHQPPVALMIGANTITIVQLNNKPGGKPSLLLCKTFPIQNLEKDLYKIVKEYSLQMTHASLILLPPQYQIFILDKKELDIAKSKTEIAKFLADISDYTAEKLVYDYLEVSGTEQDSDFQKTLLVAAHKEELAHYAYLINAALLDLTKITVTDLALRNLCNAAANEDELVLLLFFYQDTHKILVCKNGVILLVRNLMGNGAQNNPEDLALIDNPTQIEPQESSEPTQTGGPEIEFVIDNIKNSFSYCTSILRIKEPDAIFVLTSPLYSSILTENIRKYIEKDVTLLSPDNFVETSTEIPLDTLEDAMIGIGGLL
jgi:hypothetical protein